MANSEHLAKLKEGAPAWNDWRKANPEIFLDLIMADLHEAKLNGSHLGRAHFGGANFRFAHLSGADLRGADLRLANLSNAHLGGADLSGADLRLADLSHAHLSGADLSGADLRLTNLSGATLSLANLYKATVGGTTFGNNDLSEVKGLDAVQHDGPSTIGVDTIFRSQGKIPTAFLRGAGVPDNFIQYMGSLTGKALEFYSCFISYSTKDQEFADRLHADLQNKGVRCWFAPHDIQAGKYTIDQIDKAIRMHERLLLILSRKSMKSKWVETEIVEARKREVAEKRRVLFPIRLVPFKVIQDWKCFDSDTGEDLAREIRKFHIPDFSDWENRKSYAEGLKNLLRDLKAEAPKAV
jgi:hypothetical protein